jgi:hypothetical protein
MRVSSAPSSPKRWTCNKCQVVRSKEKGGLCPVCWLVGELAREHRDKEHVDKGNASCVECTRQMNDTSIKVPAQNHDDCDHERTSQARAACRRERRRRIAAS